MNNTLIKKTSPFIKVQRVSPFTKVIPDTQSKVVSCQENSQMPTMNFQQIIPEIKQLVNEFISAVAPPDKPQQVINETLYVTNGSIGREVVELFVQAIHRHSYELTTFLNSRNEEEFIRHIALILTQELKIVVKHQRWIYVYNGKIYVQCQDENVLVPIIREFCELGFINLSVSGNPIMTSAIIREVFETACFVDENDDISRYIVFNDGVLDLYTKTLGPFTPGKFITSMVTANWNDAGEECSTFTGMLNLYTQGDTTLKKRLLEALGLCLTNDTVKRIICFQGVTNSGKSLLVSFLMKLLNDEAIVSMYPNDFSERFALSKIYGKNLCVCMDMEAAPLNAKATAVLKQISGNDRIGAEFKYANGSVMFRSKARVVLCSNFNITPSSEDVAFNTRKLVIPFTHRITEEMIPYEVLMHRLETEKNAIVKLLVSAYLDLKNRGYVFSGDGNWYDTYNPANNYMGEVNKSIKAYINNFYTITLDDKDFISLGNIYAGYKKFMELRGVKSIINPNQFSSSLRSFYPELGHIRKRVSGSENPLSCFTGLIPKT